MMKKFGIFLILSIILISNSRAFASFDFIWTGNRSGTIIFSSDKYSDTPYKYSFNEQEFIETITEIHLPDGSKIQHEAGKCIINQSCSPYTLGLFANAVRSLALQNKYLIPDANALLRSGKLREGKDYIIDQSGRAVLTGKIKFILENSPGNFRRTQINDVSLITSWETGKQEIEEK